MDKIIGIEVNLNYSFFTENERHWYQERKLWNHAWSSYTTIIRDSTISWRNL
jgi:hypothetical protein